MSIILILFLAAVLSICNCKSTGSLKELFSEIAKNNKDSNGNLVLNINASILLDNSNARNGEFDFLKDAKLSGLHGGRNSLFTVNYKDESNSVIKISSSVSIEHFDFSLTSFCSFPSLISAISSSFVIVDKTSFSPPRKMENKISPFDGSLFAISDSLFTLSNSVVGDLNFTGLKGALVVRGKNAQVSVLNSVFKKLALSLPLISIVMSNGVPSSQTDLSSLAFLPSPMHKHVLTANIPSAGFVIHGTTFENILINTTLSSGVQGFILDGSLDPDTLIDISQNVIENVTASYSKSNESQNIVNGIIRLKGVGKIIEDTKVEFKNNLISNIMQKLLDEDGVESFMSSFGVIFEDVSLNMSDVNLTAATTLKSSRKTPATDPLECKFDTSGNVRKHTQANCGGGYYGGGGGYYGGGIAYYGGGGGCYSHDWILYVKGCVSTIANCVLKGTQAGCLVLEKCIGIISGISFGVGWGCHSRTANGEDQSVNEEEERNRYADYQKFYRNIEATQGSKVNISLQLSSLNNSSRKKTKNSEEKDAPNLFFFASPDSSIIVTDTSVPEEERGGVSLTDSPVVPSFVPRLKDVYTTINGKRLVLNLAGERLFACNLMYKLEAPNGTVVDSDYVFGVNENAGIINTALVDAYEDYKVSLFVWNTSHTDTKSLSLNGKDNENQIAKKDGTSKSSAALVVTVVAVVVAVVVVAVSVAVVMAVVYKRKQGKDNLKVVDIGTGAEKKTEMKGKGKEIGEKEGEREETKKKGKGKKNLSLSLIGPDKPLCNNLSPCSPNQSISSPKEEGKRKKKNRRKNDSGSRGSKSSRSSRSKGSRGSRSKTSRSRKSSRSTGSDVGKEKESGGSGV